MNAIVLNIFEINYSQMIQYEILEKLVTFIVSYGFAKCRREIVRNKGEVLCAIFND